MPIAKCQQQNLSEPVKTQHIEQYMQEIILCKHICRYRPWTIQKHSYLRRQRQEITDWKDVYTRQLGKYPKQADNQEKSNINRNKPPLRKNLFTLSIIVATTKFSFFLPIQ